MMARNSWCQRACQRRGNRWWQWLCKSLIRFAKAFQGNPEMSEVCRLVEGMYTIPPFKFIPLSYIYASNSTTIYSIHVIQPNLHYSRYSFFFGDVESRVIRVMPKPDVVRRSSESIFKTHHSPQSQLHSPPSLFLFLFCWPFYWQGFVKYRSEDEGSRGPISSPDAVVPTCSSFRTIQKTLRRPLAHPHLVNIHTIHRCSNNPLSQQHFLSLHLVTRFLSNI